MGAVVAYFDAGGYGSKGVGTFFKAMTQAVLLFGVETWVLTLRMEQSLSSFQHKVAGRLTGGQSRIRGGASWEYP